MENTSEKKGLINISNLINMFNNINKEEEQQKSNEKNNAYNLIKMFNGLGKNKSKNSVTLKKTITTNKLNSNQHQSYKLDELSDTVTKNITKNNSTISALINRFEKTINNKNEPEQFNAVNKHVSIGQLNIEKIDINTPEISSEKKKPTKLSANRKYAETMLSLTDIFSKTDKEKTLISNKNKNNQSSKKDIITTNNENKSIDLIHSESNKNNNVFISSEGIASIPAPPPPPPPIPSKEDLKNIHSSSLKSYLAQPDEVSVTKMTKQNQHAANIPYQDITKELKARFYKRSQNNLLDVTTKAMNKVAQQPHKNVDAQSKESITR